MGEICSAIFWVACIIVFLLVLILGVTATRVAFLDGGDGGDASDCNCCWEDNVCPTVSGDSCDCCSLCALHAHSGGGIPTEDMFLYGGMYPYDPCWGYSY